MWCSFWDSLLSQHTKLRALSSILEEMLHQKGVCLSLCSCISGRARGILRVSAPSDKKMTLSLSTLPSAVAERKARSCESSRLYHRGRSDGVLEFCGLLVNRVSPLSPQHLELRHFLSWLVASCTASQFLLVTARSCELDKYCRTSLIWGTIRFIEAKKQKVVTRIWEDGGMGVVWWRVSLSQDEKSFGD